MSNDAVERAKSLLGTRFRAQGRNPELGLDFLGLAMAAYGIDSAIVRRDYRLSGDHRRALMSGIGRDFRRIARTRRRPGDLMLIRVASDQWHLAIATDAGFIHADARRGCVVETPGEPRWGIAVLFRKRVRAAPERGAS